jgi:MATE family multidrug resistance protein
MRPGTYVLLFTSPLNAALNYLFIYPLNMGLLGAPFATGISYWLSFILLVLYARFVAGYDHWGGWTKDCFKNMGTFARLAFLGVIHVGTEWWAFEIVAIVAGQLGTIDLASQSVIMTADQVRRAFPATPPGRDVTWRSNVKLTKLRYSGHEHHPVWHWCRDFGSSR